MSSRDVVAAFKITLERTLGIPDGRTDEEVENVLRVIHGRIFDAVEEFDRALNYQDSELSLIYEFRSLDRSKMTALCGVKLIDPDETTTITFTLSQDGILADTGYLATASADKGGWWPLADQADFIERLSFAVLKALGADLD